LVVKWYLTIPGLLISLAMAGVTFSVVPPLYSSSGVAVLVQPKQPGASLANPLLGFDSGLTTTAAIMIQSLDAPTVAPRVSVSDRSSFHVKNASDATTGDVGVQPFIYINTQSPIADDSAAMVSRLIELARQDLADRQQTLRVRPTNYIRLETVVQPTKPKYLVGTQVAVSGAAFLVGIVVTIGLVLLGERFNVGRRREPDSVLPEDARHQQQAPWPPASDIPALSEPALAASPALVPSSASSPLVNARLDGQYPH